MVKYYSYKELKEKETELYLKLKRERKEFNMFTLTGMDAENLVQIWNYHIRNYGLFTLNDLKPIIEDFNRSYIDTKYGWTSEISLNKDFIINVYNNCLCCRLNLQPYKEID